MILPTKFIPENQSLLYIAGVLFKQLSVEHTVSDLWHKNRSSSEFGTIQQMLLALDLLFTLGLIKTNNGMISRNMEST